MTIEYSIEDLESLSLRGQIIPKNDLYYRVPPYCRRNMMNGSPIRGLIPPAQDHCISFRTIFQRISSEPDWNSEQHPDMPVRASTTPFLSEPVLPSHLLTYTYPSKLC